MHTMNHRDPGVNYRIAEYRRREREADDRLRAVVRASDRFGRHMLGDGEMTTRDVEAMTAAAKRAAVILAVSLIVFGSLLFVLIHWALIGSFFGG